MKRFLLGLSILICILINTQPIFAESFGDSAPNKARQIKTSTTDFNGALSASNVNVQSSLDTLDNVIGASSPLVDTYLKLDASNDPLTGNLESTYTIQASKFAIDQSTMYFDSTDSNTLKLYINSTLTHTWALSGGNK